MLRHELKKKVLSRIVYDMEIKKIREVYCNLPSNEAFAVFANDDIEFLVLMKALGAKTVQEYSKWLCKQLESFI